MDTQGTRPHTIALFALALIQGICSAATIPEPETIFFGKVLVRSGGQDFQLQAGQLSWSIGRARGAALVFSTELEPLAGGAYSYQLKVPHEAATASLQVSGVVVPLEFQAESHEHLAITIDGQAAVIAVPGDTTFSVEQARRAKTFRIDLRVDLDLADSDGDEMADWWELAHGLDAERASDADLDGDGDGLSNLAEFLAGSDPNANNRRPELLTQKLLTYADGTTGINLQSADTDSAADEIIYTLTRLPQSGQLLLREPEVDMEVGTNFTQEDVNDGRLVYVHQGGETERQEIEIALRDENPAHAPSAATVELEIFRPSDSALAAVSSRLETESLAQPLRVRNYLLGRDGGLTIWDLMDAPTPQGLNLSHSTLAHAVTGGQDDDELTGGEGDDMLLGHGGDDLLRGGPGADTFIYPGGDQGIDTILDFSLDEGDSVDLRQALDGASMLASDYVALDGERLGIDRDGDGSGFTDLVITLEGNYFAPGDLRPLIDGGHLILGDPRLLPLVSIEALVAEADENDTTVPGEFSIARSGPTDAELWVNLSISGSATNGVDYSLVESLVRIPAGESSVVRRIVPHVDAIMELSEVVEIRVTGSPDYEVAQAGTAQLSIIDLMPQITLQALKPLAMVSPNDPGAFLINRRAVLDRSVLIRLSISGSAENGIDYERLAPFVNLAAWQTDAVVELIPKSAPADGETEAAARSMILQLVEDPVYRVGNPQAAQVIIVDRATSLEEQLAGAPVTAERLMDYAFRSRVGFPQPSDADGRLQIEFDRNWAASDLEYIVEISSDLKSWHRGAAFVQDVTPFAWLNDDVNRRIFESATPNGDTRYFMRVRLERK